MFKEVDFHLGCRVVSSDGCDIGTLESVLVDDEGFDLRHLVVKESPMASGHHWYRGANMLIRNVVIPGDGVGTVTHDEVALTITLAAVRKLPPFISYNYVGATRAQLAVAVLGGVPVWTVEQTIHKPSARELNIEKDERVMLGRTGKVLGHVHDVVYDDGGEIAGIVVRPSGFLTRDVLLQIRFIDRADDLCLFTHVTAEDLDHLAPFQP